MNVKQEKLKSFLDDKVIVYNNPTFIERDPIQIPHKFSKKEDIEIAGFLTATIAWGRRETVIKNASQMMTLLDNAPYDFIVNHKKKHLDRLVNFVHRTFNADDFSYFIESLQNIYKNYGGLEKVLTITTPSDSYGIAIHQFKQIFFALPHLQRTQKHLADPLRKSAAKRICMFLRWMVRKDHLGVDFGIWKTHNPAKLSCPLDVHSGRIARKLGLLTRAQNDWKAVAQLDLSLRAFDDKDPAKYDFALFGLGVSEHF